MTLEAAKQLQYAFAITQLRGDYIMGRIPFEEFDRRLDVVLALQNSSTRAAAPPLPPRTNPPELRP